MSWYPPDDPGPSTLDTVMALIGQIGALLFLLAVFAVLVVIAWVVLAA